MALAQIQKIQLIASNKHKKEILEALQNSGAIDIIEISKDSDLSMPYKSFNELQKTELIHANLEFAITLLSKYAKKRGLLAEPLQATIKEAKEKSQQFDHKKLVEKCTELEDKIVKAKNNLSQLNSHKELLTPWKKLNLKLENLNGTNSTKVLVGSVKLTQTASLIESLHKLSSQISSETVNKTTTDSYFTIIFDNELEKEIRKILMHHKFQEAELPHEGDSVKKHLEKIEEDIQKNNSTISKAEHELKDLAKNLDDLMIIADYYSWELEKYETDKQLGNTEYNFVITGWMEEKMIKKTEEVLDEITKEYSISTLELEKDEDKPVVIKNKNFMTPFEAVSSIYGLPKANELDPTPFLATFFILFFALCLTDAGYGLLMFIAMALILKKFKLPDGIKKLVKLLMYGGVVTFFIGALFGGWFGLTPDQVPQFLTYTAENGEQLFILQKVNALTSPITVLILALALGYIQVLLGVTMKFVHEYKTVNKVQSLLDTGTWVFMLSGIGFFILTMTGVLPSALTAFGKWWVIIAAIALIITQGRDKKNIIGKAFSGILSLYGLVGYMSDILSYSRILALGLATAIIGLAVNIVADLVGGLPYIGWLLMIVVFIGGHIFNLLINALGSFIHSGRLQFVEFFTKFMEGGGKEFKPFSKKSKYIFLKSSK